MPAVVTFSGENKFIFTMDITSLYTVIPNNEGLLDLKFYFDQRSNKKPSSETLLRLAELVLTLNCFSFSNNHYQQINGVAMGTKMGPSYANLFVGYIENNQYNGPQPKVYRRYIDDCVGATSSTREELEQFIYSVNSFHPALKYLSDFDVYVVMSLTSPKSDKSEEMLQFFKNRGYPDSIVKTAQKRAQTTNQQSAPQTSQKEENQRIPFPLTFHPLNLPVKNIILKNFKLLQNDNETSRIFSLPPLISFKRNKNISDFLVRSTLK